MVRILKELLWPVKLLALDFDGTLTVGSLVFFSQDGKELVICCRRDSLGIAMLKKIGVNVIVVSKETNSVVWARCQKMGIECVYGLGTSEDKLLVLQKYAEELNLLPSQVAFVGDDANDILCMKWAGVSFNVADAHPSTKKAVNCTTKAEGGRGAVREVCDLILEAKAS